MAIYSSILAWRIRQEYWSRKKEKIRQEYGESEDRIAWWATAHGIAKSQTQLSDSTRSDPISKQGHILEHREWRGFNICILKVKMKVDQLCLTL